ncbi:MAG TPA: arylesterase [Azospirillaceae bacterium]|nr:arylesterase [Azospirillaceae bacterium]
MTGHFNARRVLRDLLGALVALVIAGADPAAAKGLRIVALGDSLTAGYGLNEEDGFTRQLERALRAKGHEVEILNAGVSGDTTAGGLARLDWTLADKPDAVIVELGANDMLRGLDPAQARANLDQILARLRQENLPVLLAGMYANPGLGRAYGDAFNRIYPDLAEKHGTLLYPFFLEGVAADRVLNQGDGLHPTREGVAVIVRNILPSVERLIVAAKGG